MHKSVNGHRNWNAWNISLWLFNDEPLYRTMKFCLRTYGTRDRAARMLVDNYLPARTPDGAPYSYTNVRLALRGDI